MLADLIRSEQVIWETCASGFLVCFFVPSLFVRVPKGVLQGYFTMR